MRKLDHTYKKCARLMRNLEGEGVNYLYGLKLAVLLCGQGAGIALGSCRFKPHCLLAGFFISGPEFNSTFLSE